MIRFYFSARYENIKGVRNNDFVTVTVLADNIEQAIEKIKDINKNIEIKGLIGIREEGGKNE